MSRPRKATPGLWPVVRITVVGGAEGPAVARVVSEGQALGKTSAEALRAAQASARRFPHELAIAVGPQKGGQDD
jgi:hypothetical protein